VIPSGFRGPGIQGFELNAEELQRDVIQEVERMLKALKKTLCTST
jgi:hypothetical protein